MAGETLCVLHTNLEDYIDAVTFAKNAFTIGKDESGPITYIHQVIQ